MKNILIVVDHPSWAFANHAYGIQRYAQSDTNVSICVEKDLPLHCPGNDGSVWDAILHCSWTTANTTVRNTCNCTLVAHVGAFFEKGSSGIIPWRSTTNIRNATTARDMLPRFDKVFCVSEELLSLSSGFPGNFAHLPMGIDTELYKPIEPAEFHGDTFLWSGQPSLVKGEDVRDALLDRGVKINSISHSAHTPVKFNPEEMCRQYCSHGAFLCTSWCEGGPLTVLESLSCNVPVVSSLVGIVPELGDMISIGYKSPLDMLDVLPQVPQKTRNYRAWIEENRSWRKLSSVWIEAILS